MPRSGVKRLHALPARLTPHHPLRKFAASVVIAVSVTLIAFMAHHLPGVSVAMAALDNTLYDAFYHFRASEDRSDGPVVIVTVDESSLEKMNDVGFEWPWPRTMWAATVQYMQACGAKVLTFDVQFKDKRFFDKEFGLALDRAKIPVVLATSARPDGTPDAFSPKVTRPMLFGATNILDHKVVRLPNQCQRIAIPCGKDRRSLGNAAATCCRAIFSTSLFRPAPMARWTDNVSANPRLSRLQGRHAAEQGRRCRDHARHVP